MRPSILSAALLLSAMAWPASADVIEIGDDGNVQMRSGVGAVEWSDPAKVEPLPDIPDAAITPVGALNVPQAYQGALLAAAADAGISPQLLSALIWNESRWRADAVSPKGATGLAQLMPATARFLAVDARDPAASMAGGARYLRMMLDKFDGDIERGLAAYNAGPGRVIRAGGIPPIRETRNYVSTILTRVSGNSIQGGQ